MRHGKRIMVDEHLLDELKELLEISCDTRAVGEAVRRIIELEETLAWLAERDRLPRILQDWEQDPDTWRRVQ
jgi:hypothetical protein